MSAIQWAINKVITLFWPIGCFTDRTTTLPRRLDQLKLALAEVEAQRRGLEHPEVADVQAVSAAVARLKDVRGQAAGWAMAIGAILKYVQLGWVIWVSILVRDWVRFGNGRYAWLPSAHFDAITN